MKRLILITVLISGFVLCNYAQNELEREILGIRDSSEIIVRNSRKLVNTRLHEHNFNDLYKIIAYAKTNIDRYSYIAFFPWEEQVLSILSGETDYFFISAIDDKFNSYAIHPQEDYLGQYAISVMIGEKDLWKGWYNDLVLNDEKKQVIRVFLGAIGLFDDQIGNQKIVNSFLKEYPNSEYKKYVSSFKKSFNFGSFEFEFGGGIWKMNGDLTQYVSPSSAFSFGMGGFSNRLYWSLYFMGANQTNLLTPMVFTDDKDKQYALNKGEDLSLTNYGLKIGWLVYRNNWVKVYPITYLSGLSLELSAKEGRNDESVTLNSALGLGAGLCSDFDIIRWDVKDMQSSARSHLGLRLSAGYQSYIAGKKYLDSNGYYCTVSLVWWLGTL